MQTDSSSSSVSRGWAICYDGLMQCEHSTAQAQSHDSHKKSPAPNMPQSCHLHLPVSLPAETLMLSVEIFQIKAHKNTKNMSRSYFTLESIRNNILLQENEAEFGPDISQQNSSFLNILCMFFFFLIVELIVSCLLKHLHVIRCWRWHMYPKVLIFLTTSTLRNEHCCR